jgi:hypothetical protein
LDFFHFLKNDEYRFQFDEYRWELKVQNFCVSLGIESSQRLGHFPIFGKSKFPKIGNFQNNG